MATELRGGVSRAVFYYEVVSLSGWCLRWAHLLALEDELAELEGDLGVVDDKGGLAYCFVAR